MPTPLSLYVMVRLPWLMRHDIDMLTLAPPWLAELVSRFLNTTGNSGSTRMLMPSALTSTGMLPTPAAFTAFSTRSLTENHWGSLMPTFL